MTVTPTTVTWDAVNKGANISLTNNNLTASTSNVNSSARATISRNSNKWYWEIKADSATTSYTMIGIVSSGAGVGSTYTSTNAMYLRGTGGKFNGSTEVSYGGKYVTNDIVSVLLNLDTGTIEFWINGVSQGIAYSSVKSLGDVFPAFTAQSNNSSMVTANFGASPFKYFDKVPLGYYSYDGSQYRSTNKFLITLSDGENVCITNSFYTQVVPKMTSSKQNGYIVSVDSTYLNGGDSSDTAGFKAFDGNTGTYWRNNNGAPGWASLKFPSAIKIEKYGVRALNGNYPTSWDFQASNDNTTWDTLDTKSSSILSDALNHEFEITNTKTYLYYRLKISSVNAGHIYISEITMFTKTPSKYVKLHTSDIEKRFITYGMDKNFVIDCLQTLTNMVTVEKVATIMGNGKVFRSTIDTSKTAIINVTITN